MVEIISGVDKRESNGINDAKRFRDDNANMFCWSYGWNYLKTTFVHVL